MMHGASYRALGVFDISDELLPARHFQRKKHLIGHSAGSVFLIAGSIVVAFQPQATIFVTVMAFINVYAPSPAYLVVVLPRFLH